MTSHSPQEQGDPSEPRKNSGNSNQDAPLSYGHDDEQPHITAARQLLCTWLSSKKVDDQSVIDFGIDPRTADIPDDLSLFERHVHRTIADAINECRMQSLLTFRDNCDLNKYANRDRVLQFIANRLRYLKYVAVRRELRVIVKFAHSWDLAEFAHSFLWERLNARRNHLPMPPVPSAESIARIEEDRWSLVDDIAASRMSSAGFRQVAESIPLTSPPLREAIDNDPR